MQNQHANLIWRAGEVPVSTRFDDPYFSLENGLAETRHVFLRGNDLPARFCDGFHIAELGFGTGLNFLVSLKEFRDAGSAGKLRFTSFEAYPMAMPDLTRALARFTELPCGLLTEAGQSTLPTELSGPDFELRIILGDARETLPGWDGCADAWFLDGFAPARNPELWEPELLRSVAAHTAKGGSFATYTAAGAVRRDLQAAGFAVERIAGFGRKRHMSIGRKS